MKVEKIPLSEIRENDYNPNRMAPELFEALVASIRDHGFVQPIVVRRAGRGYEIVDGAHRFRALKSLGHEHADCVVVEDGEHEAHLRTLMMNRLRGQMDNFSVARILKGFKRPEIERYLAYTSKQREEFKELLERAPKLNLPEILLKPTPVVVEFLMSRKDAASVEKAIRATGEESRNKALLAICRHFLHHGAKNDD
jgi:ParB family chromosome partitioning protein